MQLLAAHQELLGEDVAIEGRNFKYFSPRDSVKEKLHRNITTTLCLDIFFLARERILRLYNCLPFFLSEEPLSSPLALKKVY